MSSAVVPVSTDKSETTHTQADVLKKIVVDHGFRIDSKLIDCDPCGIGDLLLTFLGIQQGLVKPPIVLNLHMLSKYHPNSMNSVEFKIKLFQEMIQYAPKISQENFVFSDSNEWRIISRESNAKLSTFNLELKPEFFTSDQSLPTDEYIVLHTKFRVDSYFNYEQFARQAQQFYAHFKSKYTLVLLGEQKFPKTFEGDVLKIRTLYNELLQLRNHNTVIDMTKTEIYNNLDYTQYKRDINLIKNAKYNICIGLGGHYCSSMIFGTKVIHYCPFQPPFNQKLLNSSEMASSHYYFDKADAFFKFLETISEKRNILYLLNHKTLTNYEVPLLIRSGYGVLIGKKFDGLNTILNSFTLAESNYDNFLQIEPNHIETLNQVKWFTNHPVDDQIMTLINRYFKYVMISPLTGGDFLQQLMTRFDGKIIYRLFGMQGSHSYLEILSNKPSPKIHYMFGYEEIYSFEQQNSDFFNQSNSSVVPLGLSNNFVNKYQHTYNPINQRICFVCSKIGYCDYYTIIYQTFANRFSKYPYVVIGRDNTIDHSNIKNNLNDTDFYHEMLSSKVMYYHGVEPRHLHYHPLEAMVIGIPIVFHSQSLLSTYLDHSAGKCDSFEEVYTKIDQILANDQPLINSIISEQNKSIERLTQFYNQDIYDKL